MAKLFISWEKHGFILNYACILCIQKLFALYNSLIITCIWEINSISNREGGGYRTKGMETYTLTHQWIKNSTFHHKLYCKYSF